MIGRAKRALSRMMRSLAAWLVRLLSANSRAHLLEELSEEMIFTAPTANGKIRFYAPSSLLRSRASNLLLKEADTIRWIDGFPSDAVFWDIGANVGVYSLYAAQTKNITTLAFEPSAENFHVLARNIHLNSLSDRVAAYCIAFSDRTKLGVLNLSASGLGISMNQFGAPGEKSPYAENGRAMMHGMIGMSIDNFIALFAPPFPNYLKLDVDGLEMSILQGAHKTLSNPQLRSVMVELSLTNKGENKEALQLLGGCGWQLASRGESQGSNNEQGANHFFERSPHFEREA